MSEIDRLTAALASRPEDAELWHQLGLAQFDAGSNEEARASLVEAVRLEPGRAESHFFLAKVFDVLKRYGEMVDAFREAAWLAPEWADAHYNLGLSLLMLGDYEEAIEPLKRAVEIDPQCGGAHKGLGIVYGMLGNAEAAEHHAGLADRLGPDPEKT